MWFKSVKKISLFKKFHLYTPKVLRTPKYVGVKIAIE